MLMCIEADDLVTWDPQGDFTIPFAAAQRNELLELMASSSNIRIDLQEIDDVDLSAVQILLSTRCGAAAQGKHLAPAKAPMGAFVALREQGGPLECGELRDFWRLDNEV